MAFSVYTAEIRWFLTGSVPEEIVDFLKQLPGKFENQPERTDVYFLMNGIPELGIKLREGRVELKKRTAIHNDYSADGTTGKVESWLKWSIQATEELNPFKAMFQDPKHWLSIRKKRSLVKFEVADDGIPILPPEDHYPENGIALEVSALEIKKTNWWTVGLECYGAPDKVHPNLLSVAPQFFGDLPGNKFSRSNSFGYPEWILQTINP